MRHALLLIVEEFIIQFQVFEMILLQIYKSSSYFKTEVFLPYAVRKSTIEEILHSIVQMEEKQKMIKT